MTGIFQGLSNFFARHRAHCVAHPVYQDDCAECRLANQSDVWDTPSNSSVMFSENSSGDGSASMDDQASVDDGSSQTSDSGFDSASDGGFGGGESGGGGASGDF